MSHLQISKASEIPTKFLHLLPVGLPKKLTNLYHNTRRHMSNAVQSCPRIHWSSFRDFGYPQFTAAWKKNRKLKKLTVHNFQNARQATGGRNMAKSMSPNAPSTWLIFLCPPYSRFPTERVSILLLAFSLFALVTAISQCLCSKSSYLSIKLYRIYVCYTNITLYIAFGIIRSFT
jgi:hypothetical protein